ncbi:AMP-binding protein [Sorangium sp. So ce291]|uniref:AMP-binding protein n=1 Tax=Sorangium sp. So ce291 TaxID=3133294 RepID=UPI003F642EB5
MNNDPQKNTELDRVNEWSAAMSRTHCNVPMTPTTFLERTGAVFPDAEAIVLPGGSVRYAELLSRARRLAELLRSLGVGSGDCVGLLSGNSQQVIEAHFGVPATGGLIVSLNPWLSSADIAYQINFCNCRVLIVSAQHYRRHADLFGPASPISSLRHILLVDGGDAGEASVKIMDYETSIQGVQSHTPLDALIDSEMSPMAVNFTSGTTGNPKGVTYSHRAAYLQGFGQIVMLGLDRKSRYFWSVPMFHGNGWFHIWANVAIGATQVLTPFEQTDGAASSFSQQLIDHGITHVSGAPRLIRRIIEEKPEHRWNNLTVMTGGAAPPPQLILGMKNAGVRLIHQYGLNETCAAFVVCEVQDSWQQLGDDRQVALLGRQGMAAIHAGTGLRVVDDKMNDVPRDGTSLGEVVMAGNTVALGYYKNPEATEKSFKDGWFRSGDMAVVHPDGYIELKDRIKDLIYVDTDYGWLNISSIGVERSINKCPGVKDVAVVGVAPGKLKDGNPKLVAFVEVLDDSELSIEDVHRYCEQSLGVYERPHHVFFGTLPKTATGKVTKNVLVERAASLVAELGRRAEQPRAGFAPAH